MDAYRDNDKLDHRTRAVAYEKAMEQVYLRYSGDREAAVFMHWRSTRPRCRPRRPTPIRRKAAEILNKIWKEEPKGLSSLGIRHQERLHHGQRLCGHLNVDPSQFLGMGV